MMMKKILSMAVLASFLSGEASALTVPPENLFVPQSVAKTASLEVEDGIYRFTRDGVEEVVRPLGVPAVSESQLQDLLTSRVGYFQASVDSANESILRWKGRVEGGVYKYARGYPQNSFWDDVGAAVAAGLVGAGTGAAVGSIIPGPGTIGGATYGFIVGAASTIAGGTAAARGK